MVLNVYDGLLFIMPFTNELANLARSYFDLPLWVYNPHPTTIRDIVTKLSLDTVSLYGVILNLLEASAVNFDVLALSLLGLALLIFSFVIPTFVIPSLTTSAVPGRDGIALIIILALASIDRVAMRWAERYQTALSDTNATVDARTKGRGVYYFTAIMLIGIPLLYISHMAFKHKLPILAAMFLGGVTLATLVIERYVAPAPSGPYEPITDELIK